jgi:hypothetical protein
MNENHQRKIFLSLQSPSNFVRQNIYILPGVTEPIVSVPVTTQLSIVPNDADDDGRIHNDDDNENDFVWNDEDNAMFNNDEVNVDEEIVVENANIDMVEDDEEGEQNEAIRVEEECFEDLTMRDILGQDPDFFFDASSRSEIEKRVREIVFPKVKIMVIC